MTPPTVPALSGLERQRLGEKLRAHRNSLAQTVMDDFFHRHPEWLDRFGERGRKFGFEDAGLHIDFLAAAIEIDSTAAFEDYSRWLARILRSRDISPQAAVETFEQIRVQAGIHLTDPEALLVAVFVDQGCAALADENGGAGISGRSSPLAEARSVFLQALFKGPRRLAAEIPLEALRQGHAVTDIYVEIFQESLYEVGRLWETNKITVAQEHMATAIVQWSIAQLYPHVEISATQRGNAVITGVQGEYHQVGANLVADALEASGWTVRFLGTNMPHAGILQAVEENQARLLGISTTMLINLPQVRDLIGKVKARFGQDAPRIVLGGAAFRHSPDLATDLLAEGVALDVRSALDLCNCRLS
jgi:MerR family transcriptional regulator, light-induced transcriptional regulator